MAATTTSAPPSTAATITISDHSPNPDNNLYDITFQSNTIIATTVTASPSVVSTWISSLSPPPSIVGLDVEWRPNRSRNHDNPVATLQLCTRSPSGTLTCLIFQILHSPPPVPKLLVDFLGNDRITFVGAGIETDVERLLVDYDLSVAKTVDLGRVAKEKRVDGLVAKPMTGLKELARVVMGVEVAKPKSVTMSRWDSGWLSYSQIQYACVDAFLSYEIGAQLLGISSAI
ncbi:hypothetical protein vseg_014302 [Gypsophila vaccaria]